jgi:hypothetical protein
MYLAVLADRGGGPLTGSGSVPAEGKYIPVPQNFQVGPQTTKTYPIGNMRSER